jgi:DNA mismatch repair protein MutS2
MLYPHDIEQKLGFDKIRDLLRNHCSGEQGKRNVDKIRFSSNQDLIQKLCSQTAAYVKMVRAAENMPSLNYPEIDALLQKIRVKGIFLEITEVADVLKSLKILYSWSKFFQAKNEDYQEISALAAHIEVDPLLIKEIEGCIDEKGQIREHASPELKRIRSEIRKNEQQARKTLDRIIRDTRKSDMSPDDSSLTIRNGRLVIPIKSEYKRSVKGFIHDASASGNIIFIEPAEVLEINNDLMELVYSEKREVIRILTKLTDEIRTHRENIAHGNRFLGIMDLIKSKALLSIEFDANVPVLNKNGNVEWIGAVNPILKRALLKQEKEIVPLFLKLDRRARILLISGPNAGGKSVCLQTVGLLQYMYQCGFPVPLLEGSATRIFKDIFIDIGDEQSIEDDLSTYSSHLKSMNYLIQNAGKQTLFLIDEFGSGTDPQFGGAIAEAILELLAKSNGMGIITTHYNNLKKMADSYGGLVNGRMRFDVKKLEPLYQLEIGKPGSSFALEIAGKIGLPKQLIQSAKKKVGTDAVELDRLLTELEQEKKQFEEQSKKFENQNSILAKTIKNYKELQSDIDERKKEIMNNAKVEAKNLLKETNQRVETLIRNIKENKAEKEVTKIFREEVREFDKKIKIEKVKKKEKEVKVIGGAIGSGDFVRIKGQQSVGEVIQIGKKDAEVIFGDLKSKIKLHRLEKISKGVLKKIEKESASPIRGIDINKRKANFSQDLDVRGKRAEEALAILAGFLDDAILFGNPSVRLIHGKGDGILREIYREELKSYREVKSYHDEHADRGGSGITVVEFY